jgi:hypothetical protein
MDGMPLLFLDRSPMQISPPFFLIDELYFKVEVKPYAMQAF